MRRAIFNNQEVRTQYGLMNPSRSRSKRSADRQATQNDRYGAYCRIMDGIIAVDLRNCSAEKYLLSPKCLLSDMSLFNDSSNDATNSQQNSPQPCAITSSQLLKTELEKLLLALEYRSFLTQADVKSVLESQKKQISDVIDTLLEQLNMPNHLNAQVIAALGQYEQKCYRNFPCGGVFRKKTALGSSKSILPNTQIRTKSGNLYALMNKLTAQEVQTIRERYGLRVNSRKFMLGQGGFGKVRLAINLSNGDIVAVKKIGIDLTRYQNFSPCQGPWEMAAREEAVMRLMGPSDYWVRLLDAAYILDERGQQKAYLFMEIAGNRDGIDAINQFQMSAQHHRQQCIETMIGVSFNLLKSVCALHDRGMFHQDIKPDNFIHQENLIQLKLGDFYFATDKAWECRGGTRGYYPPEHPASPIKSPYTYLAQGHDQFALGITLLGWLTGQHPMDLVQPVRLSVNGRCIDLYFDEEGNSVGVENQHRAHVLAAKGHNFDELIAKLLLFNPTDRISVSAALLLPLFDQCYSQRDSPALQPRTKRMKKISSFS